MGYEHRIYIVEKSRFLYDNKKRYGEVIASFDFCKYSGFEKVFKNVTDCFIYADDGNTKITEDRCGDELTEAPLNDVISFLENELKKGENYRRIKPLLGLLKGFNIEGWGDIVCLHYGY